MLFIAKYKSLSKISITKQPHFSFEFLSSCPAILSALQMLTQTFICISFSGMHSEIGSWIQFKNNFVLEKKNLQGRNK